MVGASHVLRSDPDGYTLKTVRTERAYTFTRPKGWKVQPSSHVHVSFQHSPALLVERSSLNVMVNNRILKTIPLSKDNITPTSLNIPIPPALLKDRNVLSFQVDQHYTYDCEDPFSAELWTTVLPDTYMKLNYQPQPIVPNLAHLPYPLFDPLNAYEPTRIGFVAPTTLSDGSLEALGQFLADRRFYDPLPGEADQRAGLGDVDVAEHGVGGGDAAGGRVGEDDDVAPRRVGRAGLERGWRDDQDDQNGCHS